MSSILKALQKAEKESPRLEVSPELPTKIDTKRAVNQRARGTWLFRRVLATVVVIPSCSNREAAMLRIIARLWVDVRDSCRPLALCRIAYASSPLTAGRAGSVP